MKKIVGIMLLSAFSNCFADPTPVLQRAIKESHIPPNFFAINAYKPNYVLPFYYTGSPDNAVYQGNTPNNEQIKSSEVKFQVSLKVPLWQNILHHRSSLYFGYTQVSFWQAYSHKPFIRENDYEPELFLANEINYRLYKNWVMNFLNVGLDHQSNGYGDSLERSWDRLYVEAVTSLDNWMISLKPWYILSTNNNNNNIGNYLGYGQVLVGYKFCDQVLSLSARSFFESGGSRTTGELTWSFPLTRYLKGYVQLFSGYGQSLIEYNHRTNSGGIGVALSDWL